MNPNSKSVSKVDITDNHILYTVGKVPQPSGPTQSPTNFGLGKEFMFQMNFIATNDPMAKSKAKKGPVLKDPELNLLQIEGSCGTNQFNWTLEHSRRNTVLVTGKAEKALTGQFPQRVVVGQHAQGFPKSTLDARLYLNVKSPFSALISGIQGSGKSHSSREELVHSPNLWLNYGTLLSFPLDFVFEYTCTNSHLFLFLCSLHYDRGSVNYPCKFAYVGLPAARAQLGAKPTCLETMRKIYKPLTGVKVMPFYLSTSDLNSTFKKKMSQEPLNPAQQCSYKMRIEMLYLYLTNQKSIYVILSPILLQILLYSKSLLADSSNNIWKLGKYCISSSLPPTLFKKQIYQNKNFSINNGLQLIVSDKAHKYLNLDPCSARFTDSMMSLIRSQQQHFGTRTIISTQEPTVVPDAILDLVSFLVLHRFNSSTWIKHLSKHISSKGDWSRTISRLGLGEDVVVAPTALSITCITQLSEPLATGFFIIHTCKRLTFNGGASIVACKS
ncbi:hypothetical protein MJO28_001785 [Puccinia striiformis f. sp. tritici]|uniref:Uncharacterized protein n=1 Tax=Puccinia striiformis f. sp. tritici TaxID=168172 RepID=A0ACC0EW13_9BASI|nr:hypothetical protein MJO28_001785 [Puccinia striiformis f. sp. tritici]